MRTILSGLVRLRPLLMSRRIGNQVLDVSRKGSAAGSVNQRMVVAMRCLGYTWAATWAWWFAWRTNQNSSCFCRAKGPVFWMAFFTLCYYIDLSYLNIFDESFTESNKKHCWNLKLPDCCEAVDSKAAERGIIELWWRSRIDVDCAGNGNKKICDCSWFFNRKQQEAFWNFETQSWSFILGRLQLCKRHIWNFEWYDMWIPLAHIHIYLIRCQVYIYTFIYPDDFTHVVISPLHDFHGDHFGSVKIDVFVRLNLTSCRSMDPLGSLGHVCTEATSLVRNEFYVFLSQDAHQKFAPEDFSRIFHAKKMVASVACDQL